MPGSALGSAEPPPHTPSGAQGRARRLPLPGASLSLGLALSSERPSAQADPARSLAAYLTRPRPPGRPAGSGKPPGGEAWRRWSQRSRDRPASGSLSAHTPRAPLWARCDLRHAHHVIRAARSADAAARARGPGRRRGLRASQRRASPAGRPASAPAAGLLRPAPRAPLPPPLRRPPELPSLSEGAAPGCFVDAPGAFSSPPRSPGTGTSSCGAPRPPSRKDPSGGGGRCRDPAPLPRKYGFPALAQRDSLRKAPI